MTWQVNEPDGWRDPFEHPVRLEAKPLLPMRLVQDPLGFMCPMSVQIHQFAEPPGMHGCIMFKRMDVNLGLWKVRQTTSMVEMEMRLHNVPDIFYGITQPDHLMDGCFAKLARRAAQDHEGSLKPCGVGPVSDAKTTVYQDKTIICLNQQAMHD